MSRVLRICLTVLLGCTLASPAFAEILVLPNGRVEAAKLPHQPVRGMTMQQVRSRFGVPAKELPPMPTAPNYPTITRWVYPDYTVYFADKHVIHTVVHSGRAAVPPATGKP